MRRKLLVFGLLVVPLVIIVAMVWRGRSVPRDPLVEIRPKIGTRSATPLLAQLRQDRPGNAEVFLLSARQARLEGKLNDANTFLARAESLGGMGATLERERILQLALADPRHARAILNPLLADDPGDSEAVLTLAQAELQLGQYDKAAKLADRVLGHSSYNAQALHVRGSARLESRRLDLAQGDLEAAVASGADSLVFPPARLTLARCLLDRGEFSTALTLFQAARDDDPTNPLALFGIGRAASYLGRLEEAEQAFLAVLQLRPGHIETLLSLAQVVEQRGDFARALGYLEEAEKGDPDRLETLARMAKLLTALGQIERAERYEKRYRTLDPTRKAPAGQNTKNKAR